MTDDTLHLPEKYNDPERYTKLESGAIYDRQTKRIVANPGGGKYAITKENARQIRERQRIIGIIAHMRGLAIAGGNALPEDAKLEEIVTAAGNEIEALTAKMALTFLNSENLRGMGETYAKLAAGFMDDKVPIEQDTTPTSNLLVLLAEFVSRTESDDEGAIDGEVSETPKGEEHD